MKQFRLINTYPGSPPINTIVEEAFENSILYKCIKPPVYLAKENVENYPKYWKKVEKVSKNYEILSFHTSMGLYKKHTIKAPSQYGEQFKYIRNNDEKSWNVLYREDLKTLYSNDYKIHSIKRLSDGEVFTIGDEVKGNYTPFTITKFIILQNQLIASSEYSTFHCHVSGTNFGKTVEHNLKLQKSVKQKPVSNKIVSFGPNPNTGGIYTFNKHTDKYHSDISQAEIPYDKCLKYPVRSVINNEKNYFTLGDTVNRLNTKSNTKFDIIYFKAVKQEKVIYAYISKKEKRSKLIKVSIDNLEHFVE